MKTLAVLILVGIAAIVGGMIGAQGASEATAAGGQTWMTGFSKATSNVLARAPVSCWWWTALASYLFVAWGIFGPYWTRKIWCDPEWREWWWTDEDSWTHTPVRHDPNDTIVLFPLDLVWFFAPIWMVFYFGEKVVRFAIGRPLYRLLYGKCKVVFVPGPKPDARGGRPDLEGWRM